MEVVLLPLKVNILFYFLPWKQTITSMEENAKREILWWTALWGHSIGLQQQCAVAGPAGAAEVPDAATYCIHLEVLLLYGKTHQ